MLRSEVNGFSNTATGFFALAANKFGDHNVATSVEALRFNTDGMANTAIGYEALHATTSSFDNVALGGDALQANTTGDSNLALGSNAGINLTTGSDNIEIGNEGVAGEAKAIRIGTTGTQKRAFLAGVSGTTLSGAAQPVLVKANGQLGTGSSAAAARRGPRVPRLEAQNRRQSREIAALKREVASLSRR